MTTLQLILIVTVIATVHTSPIATNKLETNTIKVVFAVFRHGDRTNDAACTWPKDPHRNETYPPYGVGQLTKEGKQRVFNLGKELRKRYNTFLGNCHNPDIVDPVSTEYNRTKATLLGVLAGLFPPKNTCMEWQKDFNWEPIPYNYLLPTQSHLLSHPISYCANYIKLFSEYIMSAEGQQMDERYSKYYDYLSFHTGLNVTKMTDANIIYFGLLSQQEWGFPLPGWSHEVYPDYLHSIASNNYVLSTATPELKQLTAGFLLKQIIDYTQLKLTNKLTPPNRKIFLYSGHEYNVAFILRAMEVFTPHVPPYAACVLIEVHTINGVDGIKIFYEDYTGNEPRPLRVPGCDYFCPFKKFVKLLKKNLPTSDDMCDEDSSFLQNNIFKRSRYF